MGRTLIWIDDNLAKKLEIIDDVVKLTDNDIKDIIKGLKDNISVLDETIDEDVVSFRYHAQKVRDSYKKVVDEEIDKTNELWEQLDVLRSETRNKLDKTRELTKSIKEDIVEIQKGINNCNLYGVDHFLELVVQVNNMSEANRELLCKLLDLKRNK